MAVNENGVFVVETVDELKAWMREFHENCDNVWTIPSCAVYAMLQFVESWLEHQKRPDLSDLIDRLDYAVCDLEDNGEIADANHVLSAAKNWVASQPTA